MDRGIEHLIFARKLLKTNMGKSKTLGLSIEKSGSRLCEISQRLPSLEVAIRPIRADRESLNAVCGHIDRAVVPAAAVLKVFDAIHGLEKSLSDPQSNLLGYLSVLKRLEEAMRFLGDNCGMAIQWLGDIVEYLEDHMVADQWFISGLKKAIDGLRELESSEEKGGLDGGLLEVSLQRLEREFLRLLTENSAPLPMSSPALAGQQACLAPSPLPVAVIQKLQAILDRLIPNKRLEKCVSIYIDVRSSNVRASLQALDLDYLEISASEFNTVASIETYISQWGKHLEFAVKHLFDTEYKLCNDVFEKMRLDVWKGCFAKITAQAGFLAFLQFGKTVTEGKKDPIKLLKLLDIFTSLNNLRMDFNRMFRDSPFADIQNLTRDLIKRVIEGASEIFWELLVQVELQRQTPPPPDCSVPKVVSFLTDYCNKLLGDDYKPILVQVLCIEQSWKNQTFHERILISEILKLVRAIELNLETWSKGYADAISSHLFLMNNHWHLYKLSKNTKLGGFLGDSWLREQEQYKDYYSSMFLRESWCKLPSLLSREGLIYFSGRRVSARDLVKQRLKSFNEAFDQMIAKQANYVIPDEELRQMICQSIIQTVIPVYRSYMQNYGPLVEQEQYVGKYTKFTAQSLESILGSLFHLKSAGFDAGKSSRMVKNGRIPHLQTSTPP